MKMHESTIKNYNTFLHNLVKIDRPIDIYGFTRTSGVDAKWANFLIKLDKVKQIENFQFIINFTEEEIPNILQSFSKYRSEINSKSIEKRKIKEANMLATTSIKAKDYTTKPYTSLENSFMTIDDKRALIKEITQYVKLALELKKTDIEGFVMTLLKTK